MTPDFQLQNFLHAESVRQEEARRRKMLALDAVILIREMSQEKVEAKAEENRRKVNFL